jgi:outer membrane protein assembly factor BamB
VAFNKDGRVRWRYDLPEGGPVFAYVIIDGRGHVYLNALDSVRSLTDDGQLRWSVPVKKPGRLVIGGPGLIYVVSEHQHIFAIRDPEPPED